MSRLRSSHRKLVSIGNCSDTCMNKHSYFCLFLWQASLLWNRKLQRRLLDHIFEYKLEYFSRKSTWTQKVSAWWICELQIMTNSASAWSDVTERVTKSFSKLGTDFRIEEINRTGSRTRNRLHKVPIQYTGPNAPLYDNACWYHVSHTAVTDAAIGSRTRNRLHRL